jgi:hypothetical protein
MSGRSYLTTNKELIGKFVIFVNKTQTHKQKQKEGKWNETVQNKKNEYEIHRVVSYDSERVGGWRSSAPRGPRGSRGVGDKEPLGAPAVPTAGSGSDITPPGLAMAADGGVAVDAAEEEEEDDDDGVGEEEEEAMLETGVVPATAAAAVAGDDDEEEEEADGADTEEILDGIAMGVDATGAVEEEVVVVVVEGAAADSWRQTRTVRSWPSEAEAIKLSVGWQSTAMTTCSWPSSFWTISLDCRSQR